MALPNIFELSVSEGIIDRINSLSPDTERLWGKMNVAQMLAHCNVSYEMVYTPGYPAPNMVTKLILKNFVKKFVVTEIPFKQNSQTAPQFVMINKDKDFNAEKARLIDYIRQTQTLGEAHFDNKESISFGPLTVSEWNIMFYKHLHYHLGQFGV